MFDEHIESNSRRIDRRSFIRGTLSAAAGFALVPPTAWATGRQIDGGRIGRAPSRGYLEFELDEISLIDLQRMMHSGAETARSITEKYLERIESTNRQGPALHAIIEVNPDALAVARRLDEERAAGRLRGALHGIPVVLKDNIDTADRMTTTAGSYALEGSIAIRDSAVARRLREAGAILLAKANLSEWANFRSTRSTGGWSARGGLTRNPFILDRNACGSSSGSAVSVSANFCPAAIGTETDGSVVCPASITGVVGIKPTLGLVAQAGIIPIAHSQDTAGPMARTVEDAAVVLTAIASTGENFTRGIDPGALQGARIGVARKHLGRHPLVDQVFEDALLAISDAGADIVDPADVPTHGEWGDAEFEVLLYEFKSDLNQYLGGLSPDIIHRSLSDLIQFNRDHADVEMPFFGQEIFEMAVEKGPLSDEAYVSALETCGRLTRAEGIDRVMDDHGLHAIVAPTTMPAWSNDLVHGGHRSHGASSAAAVSGYPSVTVPAGHVWGLPVGILFFGRRNTDAKLIAFAYAFEQATKVRRKPAFQPTFQFSEPVLTD